MVTTFCGWIADSPNQTDKLYGDVRNIPNSLPVSIDLRSLDTPIEDQGVLSNCSANALTGALQFLEKKYKGVYTPLSRLFIYYNQRAKEYTTQSDSGSSIRGGLIVLAQQGVCSEQTWPYDPSKLAVKPSSQAYTEAVSHKISSYYRINTINEMRTCLSDGYPFVFGMGIYQSWTTSNVALTGIVPIPGPGEQLVDCHSVMAIGYDDRTQIFIVRNSQGASWGQNGYFTIPYAYLSNRNLSDDFWMMTIYPWP